LAPSWRSGTALISFTFYLYSRIVSLPQTIVFTGRGWNYSGRFPNF